MSQKGLPFNCLFTRAVKLLTQKVIYNIHSISESYILTVTTNRDFENEVHIRISSFLLLCDVAYGWKKKMMQKLSKKKQKTGVSCQRMRGFK